MLVEGDATHSHVSWCFPERRRDEMENDSEQFPGKGTRRDATRRQQGAVERV
uniref:Uncharacterized protein n=1 Tax=Hyaloperonospora arabidopsidis (strain Emoy2) TaxID=559515 RepID=M4BHX0_HYAAE